MDTTSWCSVCVCYQNYDQTGQVRLTDLSDQYKMMDSNNTSNLLESLVITAWSILRLRRFVENSCEYINKQPPDCR
jgi:hypothetical protein